MYVLDINFLKNRVGGRIMHNVNEFWNAIFEKLKILEHLKSEDFFVLSKSDCSMVFNNEFKIRIEEYFIFGSLEELPKIFKDNGLVLLQKFKSIFSICYADNYMSLPKLTYEPTLFKDTIKVLHLNTFNTSNLSFGIKLINSGILGDILASSDDSKIEISEVYSFNSVLSESLDIKPVYKSNKTFKTSLMRVGHVKLFYDFLIEDDSSLYCLTIHKTFFGSINKSLKFNILHSIKGFTDKSIVFIDIFRDKKSIYLYEIVFQNENDINSIESINEMKFRFSVEEQKVKRSNFILKDQKNDYFVAEELTPFPQANDFEKVIKYCDLIYSNKKQMQELISELGITSRQVTYYKDSCLFLKLIREQDRQIYLNTDLSKIYREGTVKQKYEYFISAIIDNESLFKCYNLYVKDNLNVTTFNQVVRNSYNMSESTLKRRLSTVRSWFKWLSRIIEMNKRNIDFEVSEFGLIEQVKKIVSEANAKRVRMFVLKDRLNSSLEFDFEDKELMRKINKSEMYFSDELQILFETKNDYYNYLK